jgi:BASS family bile acid:Na+ symporter
MLVELLSKAATVAMLTFVVSSMLAMGAGLTVSQISDPLRNARLVMLALLANFVLMPLGALALAKVLWLDEPFGVGLLLLGCAAGAPFLPKLAELAKGNLAFAVGAMVLLMVVTVGYLPMVLPLLLPGVTVDPWQIARSLLLLMLLPLATGLALKARYGDLAARMKPALDWISNASLILLVSLITAANIDKVLQVFGTRGILAGLLFIALGLGTGWLLGGPNADTKRVMALGTGQRNIAAALVVASQSFSDPKVIVMVIVVAIVGLIILMPLSRAFATLIEPMRHRG